MAKTRSSLAQKPLLTEDILEEPNRFKFPTSSSTSKIVNNLTKLVRELLEENVKLTQRIDELEETVQGNDIAALDDLQKQDEKYRKGS